MTTVSRPDLTSTPDLQTSKTQLGNRKCGVGVKEKTRRLVGNSAKLVLKERPLDPATCDSSELERLRALKWLPPLADTSRVVSSTHFAQLLKTNGKAEGASQTNSNRMKHETMKRLLKETTLPNINLTKGRFPAKELKKCHDMKNQLRVKSVVFALESASNNPKQRFLLSIREQAQQLEQKVAKRTAEIESAQQNVSIMWDLLRPLSRDPFFGKFIQQLQALGSESGYVRQVSSISQNDKASIPPSARSSTVRTASRKSSKRNQSITTSTIETRITTPESAQLSEKLKKLNKTSLGSKSLDNLIVNIDNSVFRPKKKGARAIRGNEEDADARDLYAFGKPGGLKPGAAEEYAETFRSMVGIGSEMGHTLHKVERDKRNFSDIRETRSGKLNTPQMENTRQQDPTLTKSQSLGFSKPPTPRNERKDPSKQRRRDFLKWQAAGQADLVGALKSRETDRLEACTDLKRIQKVMDVLQEDIKVDFYLHGTNDPKHWMSTLPHIWVPDSDELLKELDNPILKQLNARKHKGANVPLITVASLNRERAAINSLITQHSKSVAIAGHGRRESILTATRRQDEYQKLIEGKDVLAERAALSEMFDESHLDILFGRKGIQALAEYQEKLATMEQTLVKLPETPKTQEMCEDVLAQSLVEGGNSSAPAMSPSFPAYPGVGLHSPLGKGFPTQHFKAGSRPSSPQKPSTPRSTPHGPKGVAPSPANRSRVEDEYIRNLQQQVYLLELETRYLRTNRGESGGMPGSEGNGGGGGQLYGSGSDHQHHGGSSAPLNDAIKSLKSKYIELQESHKRDLKKYEQQFERMKTNEQVLELSLKACHKENDELKEELKSIRDHHTAEKDKLYGELLAHRKKSEIAISEHARLQKTHQRISMEKQQNASAMQHALEDAKKHRDQVEELLHINATLKVRVEELHKQNTVMQSRLDDHEANVLGEELQSEKNRCAELKKENETLLIEREQAITRAKQEEHLKCRIAQDCEELVKGNVTLKNELEDMQRRLRREFESREQKIQKKHEHIRESEEIREEFSKLKDEYTMLKIAVDNKDRKNHDLRAQINSMENALNTALETRNILEERCEELEQRSRAQESELIQMGQDKSLLIDDVAELRNTTDIKTSKLQNLIKENQDLKIAVEKFKRESFARQEFQHLMRNMKSYLHRPKHTQRDEVDDISDRDE
ncbi:hypothetical protein CcCBS67573_g01878 [Chytriomyces confervae]|uniref:Uncharacterized protein n=1 Tax=Chytriomyces confervae TaxID=246404 RepID=A0A507FKU0_9FUNG|nr:hypothetical protein CcCBS67573_g01878 [Chytriomyces confervae]